MGVPYSVLMGRVRRPNEPEWTPEDRDIAVAWFVYQEGLCGLCGLPVEVCHDPDAIFEWKGEVTTCHVTALRERAMKQWKAANTGDDVTLELEGVHTIARRHQPSDGS